MSDLNLYQNPRQEIPDLEPHAVITDTGRETTAPADGTTGGSDGAPGSQSDFGGQIHKELQSKETDVDARIAQLTAEIQQLSHEAPETSPEKQSPHGGLGGLRTYCQHVAGAIGNFFQAVFGHTEPNLDSREAHVLEVKQKINMDTQELKLLQQTRQAYQELDQRIAGLEQGAGQEQQDAIHGRTEELQIRDKTHELFDSLIHSLHGDRTDSDPPPSQETAPENRLSNLPDDSGSRINPFHIILPEDRTPVTPDPSAEPVKPTDTPQDGVRIIGDQDQETDNALVHPQGNNDFHDANTCGVVTQEMVLNRLTGTHDYTESGLTNEAASHGWFKPGEGSPLAQVGNLLEAHGYAVEHRASSLDEMAAHLAKGEQVICGVNAGHLGGDWAKDPTAVGDGSVNHVVWISGVRVETHDGVSQVVGVIVHDSGVGQSYELSADQFKQAWEPSGNYAVYVSPTPGAKGAGV